LPKYGENVFNYISLVYREVMLKLLVLIVLNYW